MLYSWTVDNIWSTGCWYQGYWRNADYWNKSKMYNTLYIIGFILLGLLIIANIVFIVLIWCKNQ